MSGQLTVALIVFFALLTVVFMWLVRFVDPAIEAHHERAYRRQWLREWHRYHLEHPGQTMQEYITAHKARPVARPRPARPAFRFAPFLRLAMLACAITVFLLFWHAFFVVDTKGGLIWFLAGLLLVLAFVWWIITEEMGIFLPGYAKTAHHRKEAVMPIEMEPEYKS